MQIRKKSSQRPERKKEKIEIIMWYVPPLCRHHRCCRSLSPYVGNGLIELVIIILRFQIDRSNLSVYYVSRIMYSQAALISHFAYWTYTWIAYCYTIIVCIWYRRISLAFTIWMRNATPPHKIDFEIRNQFSAQYKIAPTVARTHSHSFAHR